MAKHCMACWWLFTVFAIGHGFLVCPGGAAQGQGIAIDTDAAVQKLAGDHSREWVYKKLIMIMGYSNACKEGEVYQFFVDHHLDIETCVGSKVVHTSHTWSVAQEGKLDLVLKIDDKPYYLLFKDTGTVHSMMLRERSDSKTVPTVDLEFRLSND